MYKDAEVVTYGRYDNLRFCVNLPDIPVLNGGTQRPTGRKPPHGHSGDANRKIIQRLIKPGDGGLHLPKRIFHFRNSYPMRFHFPCNTINFVVQFPGFLLDLCESGL
ncbi:hypothetical protein OUZ56_026180 [Daphnia magna]|uniref:Uncharacterized protein n=1 Tax=Daphnia magna TaxID=35525 RepID=A0ABQ9ZL03_9CRUS|nr:hypothetical protein OUZ56_026180 [Daphnia magna]